MKCFLLINVKMPTFVEILTFMSRKETFKAYLNLKKQNFLMYFYSYEHLKFDAQLS